METEIVRLIRRLDKIALQNGDDFVYGIDITNGGRSFVFQCVETADRHTFLSGRDRTISEAVIMAEARIPAALKSWGYTENGE